MTRPPLKPWRGWLWVVGVGYAAALLVSILYGTPHALPGVALGLPMLLQIERAAAVIGVLAAVATVAYLTSLGYLPTQLGNIGYPDLGGRQHELEQRVASLATAVGGRLALLEQGKERTDEAVKLIAEQLERSPDDR